MSGWEPVTSAPQFFSFTEAGSGTLCCVYFTAPWCFRCKQLADKIKGFPADFPQIRFFEVDLEETEELGELLGVTTLPTFLLLRSGEEVHRVEGVPQQRPARRLAQAVRQHLLGEEPQSTGGAPEQGEQQ